MRGTTNELDCEIVRDLLPLYHDDAVSEGTKAAVKAHLTGCEDCRKEYDSLCDDLPIAAAKQSTGEKFKKMVGRQKHKRTVITAAIALGAVALATGVWYLLTEVPLVEISPDKFNIEEAYSYDFSDIEDNDKTGKGVFIRYSADIRSLSGPTKMHHEYKDGKLELSVKVPVIALQRTKDKKDTYEDIWAVQTDGEVSSITVSGENKWTKPDGEVEIPDYVKGYHEFEYGDGVNGFTLYDDGKTFPGGAKYVFEKENDEVIAWNADGDVVYDGKYEDFYKNIE